MNHKLAYNHKKKEKEMKKHINLIYKLEKLEWLLIQEKSHQGLVCLLGIQSLEFIENWVLMKENKEKKRIQVKIYMGFGTLTFLLFDLLGRWLRALGHACVAFVENCFRRRKISYTTPQEMLFRGIMKNSSCSFYTFP